MIKQVILFIWFALIGLNPATALADPLCWLRNTSPLDEVLEGPIQLSTNWRVYKLVKPFRVSPHVYSIELLFDQAEFDLFDLGETGKNAKAWIGLVPRHRKNQTKYHFEVKAHNNVIGWLDLLPTSAGSSVLSGNTYVAVGFGNNPEKRQGFFPSGSVIDEIHIRANHAVTIEHIRWTASGYWQWPCRKWTEVPATEFIRAE